jgi:hypothetical protein
VHDDFMFHAFGEDGPMAKGDNDEFQDIARKFYEPMLDSIQDAKKCGKS